MTKNQPPDHGTLDHYYIADIFASLYQRKITGSLRVEKGSYLKIVYFAEGQIAYASSNAQFERLGEVLIQSGMLTKEQLDDAMARLEPKKSLGKILVQLGYLSPKELVQGARLQVQAILDSLFQFDDGVFHFNAAPLPAQIVNLKINLPSVLLDGVATHAPISWVRRFIPEKYSAVMQLSESYYQAQSEIELRPNIEEVVSWCDGQSTVEDIASKTGLNDFFIAKVMVGLSLLDFGILKIQPLPTLESLAGVSGAAESSASQDVLLPPSDLEAEIASALSIFSDVKPPTPPPPSPPPAERPESSPSEIPKTPSQTSEPPPTIENFPLIPEEQEKHPTTEVPPVFRGHEETLREPPVTSQAETTQTETFVEESETSQTPQSMEEIEPTNAIPPVPRPPREYDLRQVLGGTTVAWVKPRERMKKTKISYKRYYLITAVLAILLLIAGGSYYLFQYIQSTPKAPLPVPHLPEEAQSNPKITTETPQGPPVEHVTLSQKNDAKTTPPSEESPSNEKQNQPLKTSEPIPTKPTNQHGSPLPPSSETVPKQPQPPIGNPIQKPITLSFLADHAVKTRDWLKTLSGRKFTIQLELACEVSTVEKALDEVSQPDLLYVLPKSYRGRSCYILTYGVFDDKSQAQTILSSDISAELRNQPSPPQIQPLEIILRRSD